MIFGECHVYTTRYYFDFEEKECKPFEYTGCGANRNNFNSLRDCYNQCGQIFYEDYDYSDDEETTTAAPSTEVTTTPKISSTVLFSRPTTAKNKSESVVFSNGNDSEEKEIANKMYPPPQPEGCKFGYKMDLRTRCYKCECVELNMTECGIPCFIQGTKSCIYSSRANSRPLCVCEDHYDGIYCQTRKFRCFYAFK